MFPRRHVDLVLAEHFSHWPARASLIPYRAVKPDPQRHPSH
jgi:hypothetical protein